jgi:hypothetical protein
MPKILLVPEGAEPDEYVSHFDVPLADCIDSLGLIPRRYMHGLKTRRRIGFPGNKIVGGRHVVVRIEESEAHAPWRAGFYVLPNVTIPELWSFVLKRSAARAVTSIRQSS